MNLKGENCYYQRSPKVLPL